MACIEVENDDDIVEYARGEAQRDLMPEIVSQGAHIVAWTSLKPLRRTLSSLRD
jgi:hypothetical protein